MKTPKDNFSRQAKLYQRFRPHYPAELYEFLFSQANNFDQAWDCGTGNGQVALQLAHKFNKVYASDISRKQLAQAERKENIEYLQARAEEAPIPDNSTDLITVAQAIHWFDFEAFYQEVRRVAKPAALLAVWGYGLIRISPEVDPFLQNLYSGVLGPYWDAERKWIDEHYQTIPFPFDEVSCPEFFICNQWTRQEFIGYLSSWSSLQHYIKKQNNSPLPQFEEAIAPYWKSGEKKDVNFPVFMRLGKLR